MAIRRLVLVVIAGAIAMTTGTSAPDAYACSCASYPVAKLVKEAENVYIGHPPADAAARMEAAAEANSTFPRATMPFAITRVLDGDLRTRITVRVIDLTAGNCGAAPLHEDEFLLLEPRDGPVVLGGCSFYAWDGIDEAVRILGAGVPVAVPSPPVSSPLPPVRSEERSAGSFILVGAFAASLGTLVGWFWHRRVS